MNRSVLLQAPFQFSIPKFLYPNAFISKSKTSFSPSLNPLPNRRPKITIPRSPPQAREPYLIEAMPIRSYQPSCNQSLTTHFSCYPLLALAMFLQPVFLKLDANLPSPGSTKTLLQRGRLLTVTEGHPPSIPEA